MNLMDQNKKLEDMIQKLTKLETKHSELKNDPTKRIKCEKIMEDISQLKREIAELKMQIEVNTIMIEYSQKKDDRSNSALCSTLKNQAATIMCSNFKSLIYTAGKYYAGRGTEEDYKDAVQTALFEAIEKYDSQKSDNFCAFFYNNLEYAVKNELGKEYIDTQANKKKAQKVAGKKKGSSSDESTEKSVRYIKRGQSVDALDGSEDKPYSPPVIDPTLTPDELSLNRMSLEEFYTNMAVCVVRINSNEYFRAFAAEQYIKLCREHLNGILDINENEAFNHVMNIDFVDYTLDGVCRSFYEIEITPCKLYSEFGLYPIGETENATKWVGRLCVPFENPILEKFFGVTDSAIKQQRTKFEEKVGIKMRKQ